MDDDALLRYSRQILLPQVGIEGQEKLSASHVLILGVGGLGSPAALYLAAAGVGRLTLVDFDEVELSNLQRQIIHSTERIGQLKVESGAQALRAINPLIEVRTLNQQLDLAELQNTLADVDIVLDCSDNFATRFMVNRACFATGTALASAAVIRFEGQLSLFDPTQADSPCYHCLYGEGEAEAETCSQTGVLASLPGVMGSLQATEALKWLLGLPTVCGQLVVLDALRMDWRSLRVKKDPHCPVCASPAASS